MLAVQRLNMDNAWLINWDETSFLLDPWLSGTEIDGFSWFNEQWHGVKPIDYKDLPKFDLVVVSQGYPDHCHIETLNRIGSSYPIAAVPKAYNKIKNKVANHLFEIPKHIEPVLAFKDLKIFRLVPDRTIATFNALVIQKGNEYILHAPHGGPFTDKTVTLLEGLTCKCLITTFTLYQLPFFLGGKINPGINAALKLVQQFSPQTILNTHDENKPAKGISNKIAKRLYPNLQGNMPSNFTFIDNYKKVELT